MITFFEEVDLLVGSEAVHENPLTFEVAQLTIKGCLAYIEAVI
jgi:hypothetical protein